MPSSRRSLLLIAACVVAVDQLTKTWAVNALSSGRVVHVVWTLQFALGYNSGMAFSRATGYGPVIGVVATVAVVWMLAGSFGSAVGIALVAGGAAGNLADRMFRGPGWLRGSVVDFIDLQWWPVFNIADSAITVGGIMLVIGAFLARDGDEATDGAGS